MWKRGRAREGAREGVSKNHIEIVRVVVSRVNTKAHAADFSVSETR